MIKRELTCIGCPLGCPITVTYENIDSENGLSPSEPCGADPISNQPPLSGEDNKAAVPINHAGRVKIIDITGYTCPRGKAYAEKEVTDPRRTVTTSVKVTGGIFPVVNVKTSADIPKTEIFACVNALRDVTVAAPVKIGDTVLKNVAGTGIDVICAGNVQVR